LHFDIADLRLFVHIAEERNLTRGASRAALSAAAASARLKSLESQLGQRLFYRDSRGLTLTPAGETLLRHARIILRQVEHVRSDLSAHASDKVGHFRIFANTTAITEVLPEVLARFMGERPHVTVDIQERNTREVVRGILDSAADVGVVAGPVATSGLETQCFSTDRLVLVTPQAHPLATRESIAFSEAVDYPQVGLRDSTLHDFLIETVSSLNRRLEVRVLMGSFESMCRMIEAGVGIGVLPESAARRLARGSNLRIVQLSDAWAVRERRVVYRELDALPACARAFVDALVQRGTKPEPDRN
jgi:DNA-binding transcriptional LysR family regulator